MEQIPDGVELTPFDETFYKDPYPVYERLRRLDPVHQDGVSFFENSWTVSSYEHVKALINDPRLSVNPAAAGLRRDPRADNPVTLRAPDMMNLDGDDHSRLRKLVQKAFTPSSVDAFSSTIEQIADRCLDEMEKGQMEKDEIEKGEMEKGEMETDVVAHLSKPLPTIVIAEYIGIDASRHEDFKQWTDSLLKQGYPMPTEEQWQEIIDADAALRSYAKEVIAARRDAPRNDLITRLVDARDQQDLLSENEIVDMCCLLIGAGNFTTTDLISNAIHLMLTRSDKAASPEELADQCVSQDPPVMAVRRYAAADITVADKHIKKGSVVNLLVAAANQDPAGDPGKPLTFGHGAHHCLGAALAKLETRIALKKFAERFPKAKLVSARRSKRLDFRGFTSLVVRYQG